MTGKRKPESKKEAQAKRVVTEIAPGVRVLLDSYMRAYNEGPERVSSPIKYTDIINKALDEFLPSNRAAAEETPDGEGE